MKAQQQIWLDYLIATALVGFFWGMLLVEQLPAAFDLIFAVLGTFALFAAGALGQRVYESE